MDLNINRVVYEFSFARDTSIDNMIASTYLILKAILKQERLTDEQIKSIVEKKMGFSLTKMLQLGERVRKETRIHLPPSFLQIKRRRKIKASEINPLRITNLPIDLAWKLHQISLQSHKKFPLSFAPVKLTLDHISAITKFDFNQQLFNECFEKIQETSIISSKVIMGSDEYQITLNIMAATSQFFFKKSIRGLRKVNFDHPVTSETKYSTDPLIRDVRSVKELIDVIRPAILSFIEQFIEKLSEIGVSEDLIKKLQNVIPKTGLKLTPYYASYLGHGVRSDHELFNTDAFDISIQEKEDHASDWINFIRMLNFDKGYSTHNKAEIIKNIINSPKSRFEFPLSFHLTEDISQNLRLEFQDLFMDRIDIHQIRILALDLSMVMKSNIDLIYLSKMDNLIDLILPKIDTLNQLFTRLKEQKNSLFKNDGEMDSKFTSSIYSLDLSAMALAQIPPLLFSYFHRLKYLIIDLSRCKFNDPKQLLNKSEINKIKEIRDAIVFGQKIIEFN